MSMWDGTCELGDVLVKEVHAFVDPTDVLTISIPMAEIQRWLDLAFVHAC